jgi:hypothetical protein
MRADFILQVVVALRRRTQSQNSCVAFPGLGCTPAMAATS